MGAELISSRASIGVDGQVTTARLARPAAGAARLQIDSQSEQVIHNVRPEKPAARVSTASLIQVGVTMFSPAEAESQG